MGPDAFGYGVDTFMIRLDTDAFIYMSLRVVTGVSSISNFRFVFFLQNLGTDSTDPVDTTHAATVIDG